MNEDILKFVEKNLGEHDFKGGKDIKVKKCPYCGAEDYKFLINAENGKWVCNHKNKCGESGGLNKLKLKLGIKVSFREATSSPDNEEALNYTKEQQMQFSNLNEEQIDFFKKRGISIETLKLNRIANRKGVIAFPYFKNNNLMTFKFRTVKEKKFYQEGGKPMLFGYDDVKTDEPLVIVEGEMDMLTFKECGINNVVSVPFGAADLRWIDYCWDKLEKCNDIVLCMDSDEAGKQAAEKIKSRFNSKILSEINLGTYKDINEMLVSEGNVAVITAYNNREHYAIKGCYDATDIEITEDEEAFSSFECIDNILHGFRKKELTIWSGEASSGKSTILNQIILQTIEQGGKVALFSGEMSNPEIIKWLMLQCYGKESCDNMQHKIGSGNYYKPKKETIERFKKEFKGKLFIMEEELSMSDNTLINKMKYLSMRNGIDRFVLDNLMKIDYEDESDKNSNQKKFMNNCVLFCKKYNCHIDLVAHPKKPVKGELPSMYDIAGASEIVNLAFNIIRIKKVEEEEAEKMLENGIFDFKPSGVISVLKNRKWGKTDLVGIKFDAATKRFYSNEYEKEKSYEIVKKDLPKTTKDFVDFWEGEIIK